MQLTPTLPGGALSPAGPRGEAAWRLGKGQFCTVLGACDGHRRDLCASPWCESQTANLDKTSWDNGRGIILYIGCTKGHVTVLR